MPGQQARRGRGRPARISRDQIVAAAFDLGLDGLTMAAVAQHLGTTHQALYGWVTSRDELFDLVTDTLAGQLAVPGLDQTGDWRASLRAFADSLGRLLSRLPGFAAAGLARYRTSPPFLRLNEQALQVLTAAGFTPGQAQRIYQTFGTALLGWRAREDAYRDLPAAVTAVLDGPADARFPLTRTAALAELATPPEDRYQFLTDALLAGFPDPPAPQPPRVPPASGPGAAGTGTAEAGHASRGP
jgi:AcrR family transcriptional regulator